jgi:photosystem II stability/assembly factor-like uncharacterized protein
MKKNIFFVLICAVLCSNLFTQCKKGGDTPDPVNTPPADSLGVWQNVIAGISPADNNLTDIWFTSPQKGFFSSSAGNLYTSQDSGKSWTLVRKLNNNNGLINIFFLNAQYGYIQSQDSIYISKDNGTTWQAKKTPSGINQTDFYFISPSTGFLLTGSGLYKTADTGNTWLKVFNNSSEAICFTSGTTGYLAAADRIYKTTNGGDTWAAHSVTNVPGSSGRFSVMQYTDAVTGWLTSNAGLYKTTDAGVNWTLLLNGLNIRDVHFTDNNTGYANTDKEIYKTTNGGVAWTRICKLNTSNTNFIELYFINAATGWACGSSVWRYKL